MVLFILPNNFDELKNFMVLRKNYWELSEMLLTLGENWQDVCRLQDCCTGPYYRWTRVHGRLAKVYNMPAWFEHLTKVLFRIN
jgi:hypothetical protein